MTERQGRLAFGLQCAARAAEADTTSTEAQAALQRVQTAIDNCGLDPGLFWQWQHCLDQRAKLDKQLLHELGQDSRQLSEYSKNVATELVVALRGMLDQVSCCFVAAIACDYCIAKLVSCS